MKILFTTSWTEETDGGAPRVAFELAEAAAKFGIETAILYPADETKVFTKNNVKHITLKSIYNVDVAFPKITLLSYRKISKILKEFDPDLVHSHNEAFMGVFGELWAITNHKPIIITCHMLPTRIADWMPVSKVGTKLLGFVNKFGFAASLLKDYYNNCNALIALNNTAEADIREFGYKGELWLIPNGRNLEQYSSLNIPKLNEKINLIFIGQIHKRKNQELLVSAMKFLPRNYHLSLVGTINDPDLKNRLDKAIKLNKLNNVEFIGAVSHDQIPKLLEKAHFFVSGSLIEVQSLSVMEALAAGKPIIALANETINQFVDPSIGVVLPQDTKPEEFAKRLVEFVNKGQEHYELSAKNARLKMQAFDWSEIIKTYSEKCQELITRPYKQKNPRKLQRLINVIPSKRLRSYFEKRLEKNTASADHATPKKFLGVKSLFIIGATLTSALVSYSFFTGISKLKRKKKAN